MTKTYYPDPVTVEVRIENQRMYLQFSTTINKLIKKSEKKVRVDNQTKEGEKKL